MNVLKNRKYVALALIMVVTLGLIGVLILIDSGTFIGKVTAQDDRCFDNFVGGSECTWEISGKKVTWQYSSAPGSSAGGEIRGFKVSEEITGKLVIVKATKVSKNNYELKKSTNYIQLID